MLKKEFTKLNDVLCQNQRNLLAEIPPNCHKLATPGSHKGNLRWEEIEALEVPATTEPRTHY